MSIKTLLAAATLFIATAQASTIAVIDSGTDMLHKDIAPQAWKNAKEKPRNNRDDDRNGFVDDIYGWNFAEDNAKVIDYKYLGRLTADVRRFFEIQQKVMVGRASSADVNWMRRMIQNEDFRKELQVYGNFMHGTHVAGIAINKAENAKVMAVKLIPTEVKLPGNNRTRSQKDGFFAGMGMSLFKSALRGLAKQQMKVMTGISHYVDDHKMDVANGSFGTGYKQMKLMIGVLFEKAFKRPMNANEERDLLRTFFSTLLREGRRMVAAAPNTLFIYAAGNDGTNNDRFPTSPANIVATNVISVAASLGNRKLASFSNFGKRTVDVAAPGVAIKSAAPGNNWLRVSGTSQAAPYVANVAARVKDANPNLLPKEIKRIILNTVDLKSWLISKVKTSGVVNMKRAVKAAELSMDMTLDEAIKEARSSVADAPSRGADRFKLDADNEQLEEGMVLPLPSPFVLK